MEKRPLISIILTTYNRPFLLFYAIQSILNQTYTHYEIIVINDCGTDVWDIIKAFQSTKIRYLSHIKNSGSPFARNTGIQISNGEILCYLDDDDLFLENHLEVLVEAYRHNDVNVVYTDALLVFERIINNTRKVISTKKMFDIPNYTYEQLQIQNFIPINTISHKKNILSEVGMFMETLSSLEDWEFLLRMGKNNTFHHVQRHTVEVRRHENDQNNMLSKEQMKAPKMYKNIYNLHTSNHNHYIDYQRSLVILRIIKDNIIIKKSLGFIFSQLLLIVKEIGNFTYHWVLSRLKNQKRTR
jgi:glycosyltransferase involved in cell wall biosynthesis